MTFGTFLRERWGVFATCAAVGIAINFLILYRTEVWALTTSLFRALAGAL